MPVQPLLPTDPSKVDAFTLHSRLGEGAYGVVYAATHARFGRVALKVLRPTLADIPQVRARLRAEAQALQRVQGNCTAAVLEVNADAPVPYLALELVEGLNLFQYVGTHGPFKGPILEALKDGLVEALASVHAANLVHRDLKPTNIMFGPAGVKVLDFGISVLLEVAANTGTDITLGTETWMSPEQAQGDPVGPASDVFNLGMVLAYAATGVHPFGAGKPAALVYRVVHEWPNLAGVPSSLMAFVAQCLQKDALQRPELRMHSVADSGEPPTGVDLGTGVPPLPPPSPLDRPFLIKFGFTALFVMFFFSVVKGGWQASPAQSAAVVPNATAPVVPNATAPVVPNATVAVVSTATAAVVPTVTRVVVPTATTDTRRNGQGTETEADGAKYTGEFKDDMRNGQGTLKMADGSTYTGEWRDDKRNGQGTWTSPDGSTYKGGWKDGNFNGQGTLKYGNGNTYTGEFKDNKLNGQGTWKYANGATYTGDWRDNKQNGQGTYKGIDGTTYIGAWKDDKRNGLGTLKYADGTTYYGEWKDGVLVP